MKIVSIEPTPSPNAMKINLDERLPAGEKYTYHVRNASQAPDYIRRLLDIEGVKSVFHTADFISVERYPKGDWEAILSQVRDVFGAQETQGVQGQTENTAENWGEVKVYVQFFKQIPMQVKLEANGQQTRAGLPERFKEAVFKAQAASTNVIVERKWVEWGVRYGEVEDIARQLVEELDAAYDQERLDDLVEQAFLPPSEQGKRRMEPSEEEIRKAFEDPDWKKRYAALQRMKPDESKIPLLARALEDPEVSIRRLATVYFGDIPSEKVLPYLFRALEDPSPSVRRTAGDTLSDIGNPKAIGPMAKALKDPNKLVRWRAARFLYEYGDETALDALRAAQDDKEFEVRLQVKMALERIERGEEASGSVWQQMTKKSDRS